MASADALLSQGTKQNPLLSEHCVVIVNVVRFGAMVGKVAIAQTPVRRTQQDFNMSALACDSTAFLVIMTEQAADSSSSSSGVAVSWITIKPHFFKHNKFVFEM